MGLYACLIAFTICYIAARRSLIAGLLTTLAVGYVFGIVKANLAETASYFIFDSAVLGLYTAQLFQPLTQALKLRVEGLRGWMELLIFWPLVVFLIPTQDLFVRLVGLRTSIFLLPFLVIGARLEPEQRYRLALGLGALNLMALGFAVAEYFVGIPYFFPRNAVTKIIYMSKDVLGHTAFRIPATFANAHAFGGTMFLTVPLLAGAILQPRKKQWHLNLFAMGLAAAVLGVLLSATRLNFIAIALLLVIFTFSIKSRIAYAFGWMVIVGAIGLFAIGEARLQRVVEFQSTDYIKERIVGSVHMGFFDLAATYPFGNGLGGGGSSIPQFLQDRVHEPVVMENEYARIMLEQGIFGLCLWIAFLVWLFTRRGKTGNDPWHQGRRLAWYACVMSFGTALLGTGLFVSVPSTCLLLISMGWLGARQSSHAFAAEKRPHPGQLRIVEAFSGWEKHHLPRLVRALDVNAHGRASQGTP
jgi:hypothetical protein